MLSTKPNILFIMADQMAAPLLPLHDPASPIRMPHLGRLAQQGVVFDSAYCNSPLCAPSRFSLVSGQLPSRIGAFDNAANFPADIPTYAHYLRAMGYRTALSGKMHFCGPDQLHGYEERLTSDIYPADYGWAVDWDQPDARASWYHNMSSVLQAGPCVRSNQLDFDEEVVFKANQYLFDHVRNTPRQPFCLTVSMTHPHDPYTIGAEFWDLYQDVEIPMPAVAIDQAALDPHSQRILKVIDLWGKTMPPEAIKRARRAYFGACSYIDANIGKLMKTLADCGLAENTIVVFSGDHDEVIGEFMAEGSQEAVVMIRRGRYKFIYASQDPCLLYDVQADPRELHNLAPLPQHRERVAAFLGEVDQRWDLPALNARVLDSQRRRRLVYNAQKQGKLHAWDHQPMVDASQQYMRNHIDLDDLERRARFPIP